MFYTPKQGQTLQVSLRFRSKNNEWGFWRFKNGNVAPKRNEIHAQISASACPPLSTPHAHAGYKKLRCFLHFYKVQQTKRKHTPTLSPNTRLRRDETIQCVKVNKSYQRQQRTGSQSAAHFLVSADWPELKGNGYYLSLYFWTACEVVNDILSSREVSAGALLLLLPSFFFLLFYSEGIVCQSCDVTPT